MLDQPVTVKSIVVDEGALIGEPILSTAKRGAWVSVRLAGKEDQKTYLGVYIGDLKDQPSVSYDPKTQELKLKRSILGTPAIWVPDLNRLVMGYESWWSEIKSPEDLKQITDADIENTWYVKALKSLSKEDKLEQPDEGNDSTQA